MVWVPNRHHSLFLCGYFFTNGLAANATGLIQTTINISHRVLPVLSSPEGVPVPQVQDDGGDDPHGGAGGGRPVAVEGVPRPPGPHRARRPGPSLSRGVHIHRPGGLSQCRTSFPSQAIIFLRRPIAFFGGGARPFPAERNLTLQSSLHPPPQLSDLSRTALHTMDL